jgi:hypothetical protein
MATVEAYANPINLATATYAIDPAGGTGTPYTLNLHPYEQAGPATPIDNARITIISRSASLATPITLTTAVGNFLDPYSFAPKTSIDILLQGTSAQLVYFGAQSQWRFIQAPRYTLADSWDATPIIDIGGKTINWTFLPFFPGQTPTIFTHAAGVFTYQLTESELVLANFKAESSIIIAANNADVNYSYDPVFSGAGPNNITPAIDAFAHPRAATFVKTLQSIGRTLFATSDTIRWDGVSIGTSGSTVDLDVGRVTFSIDR